MRLYIVTNSHIVVALTIQVIFFIDIYLFFIETYLAYPRYTHGSQATATSCSFRVPVYIDKL